MKRVIVGFFWFLVFQTSMLMIGGALFGAVAGGKTGGVGAYEAGRAAGQAFGQQFGGLVSVAALAVAILGTWRGALPGTRSRAVEV
jgi:hypothetical protein